MMDHCTWEWNDDFQGTGVIGMLVTSRVKGYEGNQLFLPAGGGWTSTNFVYSGREGDYWSSTAYSNKWGDLCAWRICFGKGTSTRLELFSCARSLGCTVRPVSD